MHCSGKCVKVKFAYFYNSKKTGLGACADVFRLVSGHTRFKCNEQLEVYEADRLYNVTKEAEFGDKFVLAPLVRPELNLLVRIIPKLMTLMGI